LQTIAVSCQVSTKNLAFPGKKPVDFGILYNIVLSSFAFGIFDFSFKHGTQVCQPETF